MIKFIYFSLKDCQADEGKRRHMTHRYQYGDIYTFRETCRRLTNTQRLITHPIVISDLLFLMKGDRLGRNGSCIEYKY